MSPTRPSSRAPRGTRARAASTCRARSALAAVRTWAASPRDARAAESSRASVTPPIAETTTTCGAGRYASTILAACLIPAASASDAPPNLWMWGGERRATASGRLEAARGAGGVKRLGGAAAGPPGAHHRLAHGAHAVGANHGDDGRPRAGERRAVRACLPRRVRHLVVSRHEPATERYVQHVVQPGGQELRVTMRQPVDQRGALGGRPHRVPVRQGRRERGARTLRLHPEVRDG